MKKRLVLFSLVLMVLCIAGACMAESAPFEFSGGRYQVGDWVKGEKASDGQTVYYLQILQLGIEDADNAPLVWVRFNNGSFDVDALSATTANYYRYDDLLSFKYKINAGEALPIKAILYDPLTGNETDLDLSGCNVSSEWMSYPVNPLTRSAQVGDIVTFGNYEQDGDEKNGAEEIQWYVLAKEENRYLLHSRFILDALAYDGRVDLLPISWDECQIHTWLNTDFMSAAFKDRDLSVIAPSQVTFMSGAQKSWTLDRVFLLSQEDFSKYYEEEAARRSSSTAFAAAKSLYPDTYWYRAEPDDFKDVKTETWLGFIDGQGVQQFGRVTYALGVRPAVWVNVK